MPDSPMLERATTAQIRDRRLAASIATAAESMKHLANVARGDLDLATSPMITAGGRKLSSPR